MTRIRMALALTTLALAGTLGLAGCGAAAGTESNAAAPVAVADLADEAMALQAVGFDIGIAADPAPSPAASDAPKAKHPRAAIRKYLRKNTLHGSVTVQGKDGVKTIVVQRGTVTAVSATSVSVKSTDGFTATWTFGDPLRIVQARKKVATSALKTGQTVGVAGTQSGATTSARLIAIG
jgi:hypothetical protein